VDRVPVIVHADIGEPRDLATLHAAIAREARFEFLFFWGHRPNDPSVIGKECLSQWFPSPFVVDGITYATAEHFMMVSKARMFGDADAEAAILRTRDPARAKELGRAVRGFDERAWREQRVSIVVAASVAKFGQNSALREFLLGTNDRVLVEASPRDRIWGIGLAADDPRALDPYSWRGLNLLGFALMEARERLRQQRVTKSS
jgi:ribA/ribD-fused uncharacterized protein